MTPKVKENPVLREISMLGFGSMVYKYCTEFPSCPVELVKVCIANVLYLTETYLFHC